MSDTVTQSTTTSEATPQTDIPADLPTESVPATAPGTLYCANHPNTETLLRCNRCEKPICLKCATLTDVGYRCKECIRGVQASYFNAEPMDNLIGFGVAMVIAAIASPIVGFVFAFVSFGFIGIILAFAIGSGAGGVLAQLIRRAVGRRRGRYLRYFALGGIILGVLIGSVVGLFFGIPVFNISTLVFTVLSAATAYQILR